MNHPDATTTEEGLQRFAEKLARSWLWFAGLWLAASHEFGRLAVATSPLLPRMSMMPVLTEVTLLTLAARFWLHRHGGLGIGRSATALRLAALGVAVSPLVFREALGGGLVELAVTHVWLPVVAALLGGALMMAWWDFGTPSLSLGVVPLWLRPERILGAVVVFGLAAALLGRIGFERSLPLLGVAMTAAAGVSERLAKALYGRAGARSIGERRVAVLAMLTYVGLFAFGASTSTRGVHTSLEATPVYALSDRFHRLEITTAQSQSQWLIDGELQFSSMDYPRYYESLVHPALLRAPRLSRVVAFSAGLGLLEREILRYSEVERLEVVVDSDLGPRAFRKLAWLASASHGALDDERVIISPGEVSAWLAADGHKFDAAIIDLPDPTNYYWSKYFTRLFFSMLQARLAPDAVLAMQATASQRAATILLRTAEAAGFAGRLIYAPVPTMGKWYILILSRVGGEAALRPLPGGLRFLTPPTLPALELDRPDAATLQGVPLSLLHDQTVMSAVVADAEAHPRR